MLEVVDVPSRPFRSITARMRFASMLSSLVGLPLLGFLLGKTRMKNLPVSQIPAPVRPIRLSPVGIRCDSNSASHKNSLLNIWLLFSPSAGFFYTSLITRLFPMPKPNKIILTQQKTTEPALTRIPGSRSAPVAISGCLHHITTVVDDLAKMYARP